MQVHIQNGFMVVLLYIQDVFFAASYDTNLV